MYKVQHYFKYMANLPIEAAFQIEADIKAQHADTVLKGKLDSKMAAVEIISMELDLLLIKDQSKFEELDSNAKALAVKIIENKIFWASSRVDTVPYFRLYGNQNEKQRNQSYIRQIHDTDAIVVSADTGAPVVVTRNPFTRDNTPNEWEFRQLLAQLMVLNAETPLQTDTFWEYFSNAFQSTPDRSINYLYDAVTEHLRGDELFLKHLNTFISNYIARGIGISSIGSFTIAMAIISTAFFGKYEGPPINQNSHKDIKRWLWAVYDTLFVCDAGEILAIRNGFSGASVLTLDNGVIIAGTSDTEQLARNIFDGLRKVTNKQVNDYNDYKAPYIGYK